jgi:putative salt-induced outer membrane protein YdiY
MWRLSSRRWLGRRGVSIIFICLLAPVWGSADTVTLVDGSVIVGEVTKQSDSGIVLENEDLGAVEIRSSRIKSIVFDRADAEVVLVDGSTIKGEITDQNEAAIRLENEDLGQVDIATSRIESVTVDLPNVQVVLVAGDIIKGRMVEQNEAGIVLEHENLGRMEISRSQIQSVVFEKKERAWFNPKWLNALSAKLKGKGWNASLDLSLNSASGNVKNEQSTRFGLDVKRATDSTRLIQDLIYYNKISRSEVTDNKLTYGIMHDWLTRESPWFWFVAGRYDYDEFQSWAQRLAGLAGPGYHLIQTDDVTFDVRVGLGTRKEWGSENDDYKVEAGEALGLTWDMTSRQKVAASTNVATVVGDLDDYRARSSAEWQFSFDRDMRLSFVTGIDHEYTSVVDLGDRHSDTRYHIGLRYSF